MKQFRGKVMKDGHLVLDGVSGTLEFPTGGVRPAWSGTFRVPLDKHIGTGNYQLVLGDGRSGDIVITSAVAGTSGNPEARFRGSGPLQ